MKITILTLFPEFFDSFKATSIIKRAIDDHRIEVECVNFRDYTLDKHNNVDDTICGGGAGMLLTCQPIVDAINANKKASTKVVMLSPQGKMLKQSMVRELAQEKELILLCGHYEGFDERIRDYVDEEISIGDYVLTGGEVAASVLCDAIIRLHDGVIREASHQDDSYENGLLEYPQYTRPIEYDGKKVPEILLSGHHEKIRKWRLKESIRKTYQRRKDLLDSYEFNKEEELLYKEVIEEEKNKE
ncbi:tRNA (guanine37-N1)-methyltransferase [Breznakia sp. PF5-3]|uniref:tRNA (guanosine(37)-N1)-methyltransferase TrmD n=1 Tax=unclassified Breznakia TaxID=2623764 RepID=UPI002406C321|nr:MULTISPECIES: tRNA (guanosine(37)-N1)-methyltransferase TrmD [unclassified Breznakia]MDF9824387.1 tRNA (guanine37-N1)-methyltransferase [Breznakia sp. PM6-1]MDF9835116.1 tRNA (guanine37-N1)-methyltransferase [Breznakia sp. PF5-3]MDF9838235.1 tRNA (guanine37-N1)-methyltransferase [Breznakia sp. PFB2-8]MDF9860250.1 tRNA (guanine37-N1)-methyltransferase [Breznakia sp. PH5-24]